HIALGHQPNSGFIGTDHFTYTIKDDMGRTASAAVTVTVVDTSVPTAHDDTYTVPAIIPPGTSTGTTLDVVANDTVRFLLVTAVTQPAHGSVQIAPWAPRLVVYRPNDSYAGADTFTSTVTDEKGQTATASVSVTVVLPPDNTVFHVQDQTATVPENGGPVRIDLLAGDTGMLLQATGVTQPAHGTVVLGLDFGYFGPGRANAEVTYTPDPDFAGSDTFSYTVIDGNGQSATAHRNVTVVGTLPALAALDDGVVVPVNSGPNPINVLGNDTGSGVHVTAVTPPAHAPPP